MSPGEEELVKELQELGLPVSSVWDLVNKYSNYPRALPVLLKHLELAQDPGLKEGIVRALGEKGFTQAVEPLVRHFKAEADTLRRWVIGSTLDIIATRQHLEALLELASDPRYGMSRQLVVLKLGRMHYEKAIPVLLDLLKQEDVAFQAVAALGYFRGRKELIPYIRPFLNHPRASLRRRAAQALLRLGADPATIPRGRRGKGLSGPRSQVEGEEGRGDGGTQ